MSFKHNPRLVPSWEDAWFSLKGGPYEEFWLQEEGGPQVGRMKEQSRWEPSSLPRCLGVPSQKGTLEPWEEESC